MVNPWENLDLETYENYMGDIGQFEKLNHIMQSQFSKYNLDSVTILGVAGGSGLEHTSCKNFREINGIDINENYLNKCQIRFSKLKCLNLEKKDLADMSEDLNPVQFIIANLFIECIGVDTFVSQIRKLVFNKNKSLKIISCVILNSKITVIPSDLDYSDKMGEVLSKYSVVDEIGLIVKLSTIGFDLSLKEIYELSDGNELIRLDFKGV